MRDLKCVCVWAQHTCSSYLAVCRIQHEHENSELGYDPTHLKILDVSHITTERDPLPVITATAVEVAKKCSEID